MKALKVLWPYLLSAALAVLVGMAALNACDGGKLKRENEQLREELARQQQYVPLRRDTIRDTVEVVTQQVVEVERIKNVLTADEKALLKDLQVKVSEIESMQKMGTESNGEVSLRPSSDSVLTYDDAWVSFKYDTRDSLLDFKTRDSVAVIVEREYRHKFLWWRWGVKGYEVKAVNFSPYATIRYNTYVKRK